MRNDTCSAENSGSGFIPPIGNASVHITVKPETFVLKYPCHSEVSSEHATVTAPVFVASFPTATHILALTVITDKMTNTDISNILSFIFILKRKVTNFSH